MKLVAITAYYKPAYVYGGPVRSTATLFEGLAKLGVDITVITTDANGSQKLDVPLLTPTNVDGVQVIYCPTIHGIKIALGKRVISHVGRMLSTEQYKGQDVLIESMVQVWDRYPNAQLVLVGRGDDAARLKDLAMAQTPSVQNAIFMPGFVQENLLDQLYQRACVFAMPSRGEGFGLVYLEAMRWACPCIGSRVDAAECIIQHGETGLLSDNPSDPYEVAQLILYLFDYPDTARAMGQAGFDRLTAHFLFSQFKIRFLNAIAP